MVVRIRPQRRLSTEDLMLSNCGGGEDSWESLGQQGDQTSQSLRKSVQFSNWKISPISPIFIGRGDAEAETPTLWPLDAKNRLIGKDPDAGKDWRREQKGTTEDEIVGWHHCLNGCKFERAPGDGEGQGGLVCCSSWYHKESDTTESLNNNKDMAKTAGDFALQEWSGVSVHGHYQQGFAISWCVLGASLGA